MGEDPGCIIQAVILSLASLSRLDKLPKLPITPLRLDPDDQKLDDYQGFGVSILLRFRSLYLIILLSERGQLGFSL